MIIAIDGPSGSGKSSTSRGVAERLGYRYLDTGAMYRACTWQMLESGLTDREQIVDLVRGADLEFTLDPTHFRIAINGTDVTEAIREPRVSAAVSRLATIADVRTELVARQQQVVRANSEGIVAEGRDTTTVVAPDAEVRVLLVADPVARMARRGAELGDKADQATLTDQILRRDRDDSAVAQFEEAAPGVTVVDSTHLDLEQVIDVICDLVRPADTADHTSPPTT